MSNGNAVRNGFIVSQLAALILSAGTLFLVKGMLSDENEGTIVSSQFIIIPILTGLISAYFWRDVPMKTGKRFLYAAYHFLLICGWSWAFLGEGYICLLIVAPLIYLFIAVGIFIGHYMFRRKNNTVNVSFVALLAIIFLADLMSEHHFERKVGDTIIINAPIEKVWPYVVAYEPIESSPDYWLFNIGMPRPVASTVDGYYEGAGRKCVFHNGYVFDEVMTVFEPNKELTFEITHQPRDPEIMGHIDILKGQFLLKDNGNGTTTITGNSWYRLYVFPSWYYDMWAESITRAVHMRVMEHIKVLSEESE